MLLKNSVVLEKPRAEVLRVTSHLISADLEHAELSPDFIDTLSVTRDPQLALERSSCNATFAEDLMGFLRTHRLLYEFLLNKWYFDELYDFIFVRPAKWLGRFLWTKGDGFVIDGFGPDGVSARVLDITRNVVKIQTGYLYHYAFAMLIGVAGLITWFMFGLGGQ